MSKNMASVPVTNSVPVRPVSTSKPPLPPTPQKVPVRQIPQPVPSTAPGPAKLSIAAGVSGVQSKAVTAKRSGVILGDTSDLGDQWFRLMLYGPTNSRKTITAAHFGTPEETRIILTRRKEQLRPLEGAGYKYALVNNSDDLESVLTHPESYWTDPTWVKNPNRTLIVDDMTEGIALLVDDNGIIDGKQVNDPRRSYNEAGKSLRSWIQLSFRAPQHIILNALEKLKENAAGERINPDLPPSMLGMVTTDLEYVFYIKTNLYRLIIDRKTETFEKSVDGKKETLSRYIFAKNKQRFVKGEKMSGNGIFGPDEPMDLRSIWNKIVSAKKSANGGK